MAIIDDIDWHNLVLLADTATLVSKIEEKNEKFIAGKKRKIESTLHGESLPSSPSSSSSFSFSGDENPTESPKLVFDFGRRRTNHKHNDDDVARKKPKMIPLTTLAVITKRKRDTIRKKRLIAPLFSSSSPSPKEAEAEAEAEARRSIGSARVPEAMAEALRERIVAELGGRDFVLVLQKYLFPTDVNKNNNRLSLPPGELRVSPETFLRNEEIVRLKNKEKLNVSVVDDSYTEYRLNFTAWYMGDNVIYNLISKWNSVVENNALCKNDVVQLWAFRCSDGELGFAVVKVIDGGSG